jgi:ABC-type lipoprotein release transport system permease subunit
MIVLMAWRNIWRNKARSLIIMASIMMGLFAGLSVMAIYNGMMRGKIRSVIDREVGHVQIHHKKFKEDYLAGYILPDNENLERISQMPEVRMTTRRTVTTGMLSTASGSAGVSVYGIIPEEEKIISQLDRKIIEGSYFNGEIRHPILIGKKLATKLKLKIKSRLVLMFTDSTNTMVSAAFRVAAIYESENTPLDERTAYVTRESLNSLLGLGSAAHEMTVLLHRDEDLDNVASSLKSMLPGLLVERWEELSPETDLMSDMTNQSSLIITIIIMLALAFGIINTMLMAILERVREVGMLVALGMSKVRLFFLILSETIFLTLAGSPFGLLFAWLAITYFNRKGMDLSGMGEEMMSSFGFVNVIYPEFPFDKVMEMLLIVVVTAILSSLFPAIKAMRLRPVEALRK